MRRMTMQIASLVLAASLFTGCSVSNTANDTPGASGGAVSGSVAAEDKEIEQTDQRRSYLENSDNRYDFVYDKKGWYLAQYRLDGTLVEKEKDKLDIEDIEWVTDEWLYYTTEDKDGDDVLWRIPIKKTAKGDQLRTGKKEKVLKAYSMDVDYVTDSYIILEIYETGKSEGSGICKYDCETGKLTQLIPEEEEAECLWPSEYPLMWEGGLFYEGDKKFYFLEPEKEQVSPLYSFDSFDYCIDDYALTGNELYLLMGNKLYCYNCASKKMECVIPKKKFKKAVQNLKLGDITYIDVDQVYLNQGRMYFLVDVDFTKKGDDYHYDKEELFSVPLDDMEQIRHEDKLIDYLNKKGEYRKYKDTSGASAYHTSYFEGFSDGMALVSYPKGDGEDDKDRYVLYDLSTGEIRDMEEKKLPKEYKDDFIW